MRLWRIASARFPALDGEGARLYGGRWNSIGLPAVYTSEHASLAVLEKLVWTDPEDVPADLVLYGIDLPDDASIERMDWAPLPADWAESGSAACVRVGDEWLTSARSLALVVPSAVMSMDHNVLLNPRHPMMHRVEVAVREPFAFDLRLLQ
jgi:RES domain-containing protein